MYDIKESGARIKELRLKRGVTQEQMANDLGVTVETIWVGVFATLVASLAMS